MSTAAVFDCNVFLQAMLSARGPASACWQSVVARDTRLYVAPFVIVELRKLPNHRKLGRFPHFSRDRVEQFIVELLQVAEIVPDPPSRFAYARDPDDASYVDLALATGAMLVVSNDRDLLDLMNDEDVDGKALRAQFPNFAVVTPPQYLSHIRKNEA